MSTIENGSRQRFAPLVGNDGIDYSRCRYRLENITPAMAIAWLEKVGPRQRKKVRFAGEKYTAAMRNNRFHLSDSMIVFDEHGHLVNGQHRLSSCVESGQSFVGMVIYYVPVECCKYFDQNTVRRIYQGMQVAGFQSADKNLEALLRAMKAGVRHAVSATRVDGTDDYIDFFKQHMPAIEFVQSVSRKGAFQRAPVRAAIARAWYHCTEASLRRFVAIANLELPFDDGEQAAAVFGRQMEKASLTRDHVYLFGLAQSAIKAFDDLRDCKLIRPYTKENIFPLPGESRDADAS